VAVGGLTLALTPSASGTLDDAATYAVALGVVGVLNVGVSSRFGGDERAALAA